MGHVHDRCLVHNPSVTLTSLRTQSLLQLLSVAARKGELFDRIVIETSGVSEPQAIRRQFFDLMIGGHPIFDFCVLQV